MRYLKFIALDYAGLTCIVVGGVIFTCGSIFLRMGKQR